MARDKATEEEGGTATAEAAPEFEFYDPHPLLLMYPEASAEDMAAMEESVKATGVRQQIVLWTDGRNRTWLIDGRTRQQAAANVYKRLVDAGNPAPQTDNGLSLQPDTYQFVGSADDVYRYVRDSNTRKHYLPGQKAALKVRQHYYEYRKEHGNRIPDLDVEMARPDAKSADQLAREAGCNEYYIRICRRLYREAPDLLDAVAAAVMPPPKAEKELNERKARGGAGEDGPADAGADAAAGKRGKTPAPPADPEVVMDGHGSPVEDKRLADRFRARNLFKACINSVRNTIRMVQAAAGAKGGEYLDGASVERKCEVVIGELKDTMPHEICQPCGGSGRLDDKKHKRCKGTGIVSKGVVKAEAKAEREAEREAARAAREAEAEKAAKTDKD